MLPDQIMNYWYEIKPYIEEALPEDEREGILQVQEKILIDRLQCWLLLYEDGETHGAKAVVTTSIITDEFTGAKRLLIYTISRINQFPIECWDLCYEKLLKYASANGCNRMVAFSEIPYVLKKAESLGANINQHLIQFFV
jgi:hypothetical protein